MCMLLKLVQIIIDLLQLIWIISFIHGAKSYNLFKNIKLIRDNLCLGYKAKDH